MAVTKTQKSQPRTPLPKHASRIRTARRQNIIEIASEEFALNGLLGARIDEIAARTRSSKRMIYYYFGDKEGLYLSALENAYRSFAKARASSTSKGCLRSKRCASSWSSPSITTTSTRTSSGW